MTTVSLRLPESLIKEADKRAQELQIPRAEYIRRAIAALNAQVSTEQRRRRMMEVSRRVRGESMHVNAEFDAIEDAPDA
ncbi:ribbon-helix-helix protein, CopG family [Acidiferrobacter sp.]|uniref:ribbon-helix-helix protein, CopG family n=1 Tax=Acidiferrobacter sp. TaxID=1872107 RepID=UPI0026359931|nr:ribbon-helix-helix protein, CopG family [Acidiferrobacter sp.]